MPLTSSVLQARWLCGEGGGEMLTCAMPHDLIIASREATLGCRSCEWPATEYPSAELTSRRGSTLMLEQRLYET